MATRINSGMSPNYDSSGLISGYGNSSGGSGYQKPIYDSNRLVVGYTGTNSAPTSAAPVIDPNDPTGKNAYDPRTGKNKLGLTRGEQAAKDYQDSTALVTTVKNPAIAAATDAALKQQQELSGTVIKSFKDYLDEARQSQMQSKEQVNADTAALAAAPKKLESGLSEAVRNYANTTDALTARATDLNARNADTVNANIAALGQLNTDYETNARAVADRAVQAANARQNAFQSTTGTPRSGSGYMNQLAAKTTADILMPVEERLSQNRINQLTNYITPQQQMLYANQMSKITGLELPVAQALTNLGISNAKDLATFSASLAGRSLQEQMQYFSTLGVPLEIAQRLIASLPQAIASLAAIDQSNNFYGLAQDYQQPITSPLPTYNPGVAPSPNVPRLTNPFPTVNNVQSGANGLPSQIAAPGTAGPAVGINGSGQLIDARGNIVGYPKPGFQPTYAPRSALPNYGGTGVAAGGDYFSAAPRADYTPAGVSAGGQFFSPRQGGDYGPVGASAGGQFYSAGDYGVPDYYPGYN